jgi:aldose 1-epimerase
MKRISYFLIFIFILSSCVHRAVIKTSFYGVTSSGDSVKCYTLRNPSGAVFEAINYGCRVTRIIVPDKKHKMADVVLGYNNLEGYEHGGERFFGALLGRYANRIAGGKIMIDSVCYQLSCNESPNGHPGHLHGGTLGFDRVMWHGTTFQRRDTLGIVFMRLSKDGEEGYPGNLNCKVTYTWTPDNTWRIDYEAVTDKPTIVNMSQHCYFNLRGYNGGSILNHVAQINADSFGVNTPWYVPARIESVENGPLDFRQPHAFSERIAYPNEQMKMMGGYSADWLLRGYDGSLRYAATVSEPESGRQVKVLTTEPGLLIYTGIGLSDKVIGKGGPQHKYDGLILETIHHPDSPHHPEFPSTELRPGQKYHSITEYHFGIVTTK